MKHLSGEAEESVAVGEWHDEAKLRKVLLEVKNDYQCDVLKIPSDELPKYREAATSYLKQFQPEKDPSLYAIAKEILSVPDAEEEKTA